MSGRKGQQLADTLRQLLQQPDMIYDAEVTAVDAGAATCDVKLANGLEIPDVQLTALRDAAQAILILPTVGSTVQIIALGGPDYLVLNWEQIDQVQVTIGTTRLVMNKDGFQLLRGGESLKKILDDLLTAQMKATYSNGAGTTSPANNLSDFQQIQQRIPNLLK